MRERPILFSAPMVCAILAGQKTQTRRAWREQPPAGTRIGWVPGQSTTPYGKAGDRLWVRESWRASSAHDALAPAQIPRCDPLAYAADGEHPTLLGKGRPSIHMPRWASRITLEITGVRVERLQAISDADARAEGVERIDTEFGMRLRTPHWRAYGNEDTQYCISPEASFRTLWSSINGRESWDADPWVWVVEFKRLGADHAS